MHLVNGEFDSQISLLDRGLLYGHSVFETIAVSQRQPLLLEPHLQRLSRGCERLKIPISIPQIRSDIDSVVESFDEENLVLRVSVTMGQGGRGYLSPEKPQETRIVSAFSMPLYPVVNWHEGIVLGEVKLRLADQPALAGIKHGNRLEQILARFEWRSNWQEALLLDNKKRVIEGTQSNVFVVMDGELFTPDLSRQGVAGVMRDQIIELAMSELGLECRVMRLSVNDLLKADELFITNSLIGLWPVKEFQSRHYRTKNISQKLLTLLLKNELIPPI